MSKDEEIKTMEQETAQREKKQEIRNAKSVKTDEQKNETVVYVGPAIKGKLKSDTAYIKGIPKIAEELIHKEPAMKKMFVHVSEVAEVKKQISQENSALNIIYKKIEGVVQNV